MIVVGHKIYCYNSLITFSGQDGGRIKGFHCTSVLLFCLSTGCSLLSSRKLMGRPILTLSGARRPALQIVWQSFLMAQVLCIAHSKVHKGTVP